MFGLITAGLKFVTWLLGLFKGPSQDQQLGASQQAERESHSSAETQAAIAQAEVDAPRTDAGVEGRLKDGTF